MRGDPKAGTRYDRLSELLRGTSVSASQVYHTIEKAESDPDEGARLCEKYWGGDSLSSKIRTYITGAAGYALADVLSYDDEAYDNFKRSRFWKGRTYDFNDDHLLSYALMRMHGAHTGSVAAQAQREARAMQGCFKREVPVIDVFEQLVRRGGFAAMQRRSAGAEDDKRRKQAPRTQARKTCGEERQSGNACGDECEDDRHDTEEVQRDDAYMHFVKLLASPNRLTDLARVRHGRVITTDLERIRSDDGTPCFALKSIDYR